MVTDLGPGDGGKGGVVHKLSHMSGAHTIVKVGGAQGSHGVRTSAGDAFAFSQFGCGTFEGVRTHISPRFLMDPEGIYSEGMALRYESGVDNPWALLSIDESTLCKTPFDGIVSRIKELALRDNPRGTIGTGVGQAYRRNQLRPDLSVFACDLYSPDLRDKLEIIREYTIDLLNPFVEGDFFPDDQQQLSRDLSLLNDPGLIDHVINRWRFVAKECQIVDTDYFANDLLAKDGIVVVESSHGILTDCYTGFHPHTSAIRTLPHFTKAMFEQARYDGEIVSIGVHRAYQIRHGAGPMPTHDPQMGERLLPGSNKDSNRWQGDVRVGPLDLVAMRYALAASGEGAYDGLAITWFDQVQKNGQWQYANKYEGPLDNQYFTESGDIRLRVGDDRAQLDHLAALTKKLQAVRPTVETVPLNSGATLDQQFDLVAETLGEHLGVPVRMMSFGPTEQDKMCK